MKIKVVYGIDMRLWRYKITDDKPDPSSYQDLLTFITKTFQFTDMNQFKITFKDDDDTNTTIASPEDFQDAFISAKKQEKKSLKLYITDSAQKQQQPQPEQAEEEKKDISDEPAIETTIPSTKNPSNDNSSVPTAEEINAFLADDFVIDLLSDLFVSVFEALQASNYEIAFIECVQGIILSNNNKYDKITSNPIWPYFMDELLPKHVGKIEMFVIPMMKMNGGINADMIKQWIPTLLNMMKQHVQNKEDGGDMGTGCNFGRFPWRGRGRRGWRGRGWRHHHRGRGGWRGRGHHGHHHGHHGHHGHHRGGWRGRGGFGCNPWFQPPPFNENGVPMPPNMQFNGFMGNMYQQQQPQNDEQGFNPSAPPMGDGVNEDDQIEAEEFEYTEELVAIMNMGFTNISKIKKLLNEHKGNKQNVVQELVLSK